ncbi:hypothetical protein Hypma_010402 [Hypsizygus marmoreus]|uniref:Uncharacterized protein n=1 Tax=Hypsizygus marmoreus TaxID=39966 RepID=A0A369JJP9_HYPMA|nr:hypothetical protein Hypma_010402 [Hypsizygus marmoreus]
MRENRNPCQRKGHQAINDRDELQRLISNPYIAARMNAPTLTRRSFVSASSSWIAWNDLSVSKSMIKKYMLIPNVTAQPTISLAQDYNSFVALWRNSSRRRKHLAEPVAPKINSKGLFALDVDDEILQDVGLDDDMPGTSRRLGFRNDRVRDGSRLSRNVIVASRSRTVCNTSAEQCGWFAEEWITLNVTYDSTDDESLRYELMLRRTEMCHLCATWQKSVQSLDFGNVNSLPPWGPSSKEILEARIAQGHASVWDSDADDEWNMIPVWMRRMMCFEDEAEDSDYVLLETLDAVDLANSFRSVSLDDQPASIDDSVF